MTDRPAAWVSAPGDLALHGVRVLGFPTTARVAGRWGLPERDVEEALLDYEAMGWARRLGFAGFTGWSLTDAGRAEEERRLAAELDAAGARDTVAGAHAEFLPVNHRLGEACTRWQVRPAPHDRLALNDHADWRWDERVLDDLAAAGRDFAYLCGRLSACLARFGGYAERYALALEQARAGQRAWVDGPDRDSCHLLCIQFHEDLLATLGLPR
jgi:hypothetical protein